MRLSIPMLIFTLILTAPVMAQQSSAEQSTPGNEIHAVNCMVQYKNKVNVPAKAEGTLMELRFEQI